MCFRVMQVFQVYCPVESEQIRYLHDLQRESPDMKNFIKESCDSEKFSITQAQAFAQLPFPLFKCLTINERKSAKHPGPA